MISEIRVPFLGEGIEKVTVCSWHRKPGDAVVPGDDVAEVEADKAIFNIASECPGRLKEILAPEGKDVAIGQPIAIIEQI